MDRMKRHILAFMRSELETADDRHQLLKSRNALSRRRWMRVTRCQRTGAWRAPLLWSCAARRDALQVNAHARNEDYGPRVIFCLLRSVRVADRDGASRHASRTE